jgi:hypothetical protein
MANAMKRTYLDANESAFFQREHDLVLSRTYDIQYPAIKYASLFPVDFSGSLGTETITYRQYDQVGMSKIISSYADDSPSVNAFGKEFTSPVKHIGNSYEYTFVEIQRSAASGTGLDARKAAASREFTEREFNRICFFGNQETNLPGLFSNPNIPVTAVPNGADGQPEWSTKTFEEIYADLNSLVEIVIDGTNGVEVPNTIIMPIQQYRIANTVLNSQTDLTVMQAFMANNPFITTVDWAIECKGVGTGGSDVAVAYNNTPDKLAFHIPSAYQALEAQRVNYVEKINTIAACGGLIIEYPLSLHIIEGI